MPRGSNAQSDVVALARKFDALCWIAYAPTRWNPQKRFVPSAASIRRDLVVLRRAGFNGLVTYDANMHLAQIATVTGFAAVIVGVWDPTNAAELDRAQATATLPSVIGYVVGNEGLDVRYGYETLRRAIDGLGPCFPTRRFR